MSMVDTAVDPEPIVLDPEAAEQRLQEAMIGMVDAVAYMVKSAPYGIIPDPAHVSVVRDAFKKYELAVGEVNTVAALMRLAETDQPKDIQTEGV